MRAQLNLDNLSQKQFEYILELLIMYKQVSPKEDVYLNEKSVMKSLKLMELTNKNKN